jgi:hypothetical protein
VTKPRGGHRFALPATDPKTAGGSLRIFDLAATAGDNTFDLPSGAAWTALGSPAGSKGFKYVGKGTPSDPCNVIVRPTVIKATCTGDAITLAPPFAGKVGVVLNLGTGDRYCAQLGGDEVKNVGTLTKRKNAPAPGRARRHVAAPNRGDPRLTFVAGFRGAAVQTSQPGH